MYKKKDIKFLFATASLRGCAAFMTLLMSYVVTGNLSPNDAGNFFLFITIVTLFGYFFTFGFNIHLVKIFAIHEEKVVLKKNIIFALIFVTFFCIMLHFIYDINHKYIAKYLMKPFLSSYPILISFCIYLWSVNLLLCSILQGIKKTTLNIICQNILPYFFLIVTGLVIYVFNYSADIYLYIVLIILGLIFSIFISAHSAATYIKNMNDVDAALNKGFFSEVPFFAASQITQYLIFSGVIVFYSNNMSEMELAGFYLSQRLTAIVTIFLIIINLVATPKFARLFSDGDLGGLRVCIGKYTKLSILISSPVLVFLFVYSGEVLSIFGDDYYQYKNIVYYLIVGNFFAVICGPVIPILNMINDGRHVYLINVILVLPVFILGYIMTSAFNGIGMAITIMFVFIVQNAALLIKVKKRLGYYPVRAK